MSVTFCEFTGIVTYKTGQYDYFGVLLNESGDIILLDGGLGADAIAQVQNNNNWLQSMLDLLQTFVPVLSPDAGPNKEVTSLVAKIRGRVSRENGTTEDFIALYTDKTGQFVPPYHSTDAWEEAVGEFQTELDLMFQTVTDKIGESTFSSSSSSSS